MFDNIILEKEQILLLGNLVEKIRSLPRDKRIDFIGTRTSTGDSIILHPHLIGQNFSVLYGDLEALSDVSLLDLKRGLTGSFTFRVTPVGFKYYERVHSEVNNLSERIENPVRNFITSDKFIHNYPSAYEKWTRAEKALWTDDTEDQLSLIGHLCREAMQEFVSTLVEKYKPSNVDPNIAKTVSRLKSVLNQKTEKLSTTRKALVDSIVPYWGALSDLVQRQEHAAQKEGDEITIEDANCVVFQTAVIFLEIDRFMRSTA